MILERVRCWCAKPYLASVISQCAVIAANKEAAAYEQGFTAGWDALARAIAESDRDALDLFQETVRSELHQRRAAH